MVTHKFRDILEHDIDMLILEEFSCSESFCKIFLDKVGIDDTTLLMTWQSKTDSELGESDMTIVFGCQGKNFALLIEDKIDAIAMPEQPSRYILRGDKGIKNREYDYYYIFIVAPKQYLENNEKAKEYPNRVSYEEIKEYFERLNDSRSAFKLSQIDRAIYKQKNGYQVIKNTAVTEFWNKYVEYKNRNFPNLNLIVSSDIKATYSLWTNFRTFDSRIYICYKSNKGCVDLTLNGQAENIETIKTFVVNAIGNYYEKGISVVKTGKACAVRKVVPVVDFTKSFEEQVESIRQSFVAVEELANLVNAFDLLGIAKAFI